ncbi:hypothetical protein PROFUN_02982 [Planoprotostelium fungivorum]|uniref:Beta-catenin-interacting ICAT domain-containing protein n=1 Tax=Planoprotostelium fungivorum TaxID=1890364 RepID=A0A2P6NX89_9EUKA|nr:hypothetical protein PROFUN_02982 [Planoprotostelium fungivorum]
MASRGADETKKLKENIEEQLNRLLTQLKDLEEFKDEDPEEYESMRADTISQLKEFQVTLQKMAQGNMTLVDTIGGVQLAIQAAVSSAFKTPEVIKLFAKQDNNSLRQHLVNLQTQQKLGKISRSAATQQAIEILTALKKLGDTLSPVEEDFLVENRTEAMKDFEKVSSDMGQAAKTKILSSAANENRKVQN